MFSLKVTEAIKIKRRNRKHDTNNNKNHKIIKLKTIFGNCYIFPAYKHLIIKVFTALLNLVDLLNILEINVLEEI